MTQSSKRSDTIIVGAGAAGCILAARLTEDPSRSVLLIEAGPDYPTLESLPDEIRLGYSTPSGMVARNHDWGYTAKAANQSESIIRGKIVGGSSAVNAQIYLWGLPHDFDRWVGMGNDDWSWDAVEPYFRKVETDLDFQEGHGEEGPIGVRRYARDGWIDLQSAFYESCIDHGFADCPDLNHPYATGVGPYPLNNPDGIRVSAAIGYLNPARNRPNLTILSNALTHRVVFSGVRATGVEVEHNGNLEIIEGDQIVVASGAIGSPLILQRSGIGSATDLESLGIPVVVELPGVGQNLRDHPAVPMYWRAKTTSTLDTHWHQVGLRYTSEGSDDPDDMIVYVAHGRDVAKLLMRPTVNLARSTGTILIRSSDPEAHPQIDYRMFSHVADRERMREAIRLCRSLVEHRAFTDHIIRTLEPTEHDLQSDPSLDAWILENATTGHHVSSTCRMGPVSDSHAVVDQQGTIHGLEGLGIIDASIMPDSVRANIHATVLMMAEKLAEKL